MFDFENEIAKYERPSTAAAVPSFFLDRRQKDAQRIVFYLEVVEIGSNLRHFLVAGFHPQAKADRPKIADGGLGPDGGPVAAVDADRARVYVANALKAQVGLAGDGGGGHEGGWLCVLLNGQDVNPFTIGPDFIYRPTDAML